MKISKHHFSFLYFLGFVACYGLAMAGSVTLIWDRHHTHTNLWMYSVKWGNASGVYQYSQAVSPNSSISTINNLQDGRNYFFAVTAIAANGSESLPSNEISYTTPGSSSNVIVSCVFEKSASIDGPWEPLDWEGISKDGLFIHYPNGQQMFYRSVMKITPP